MTTPHSADALKPELAACPFCGTVPTLRRLDDVVGIECGNECDESGLTICFPAHMEDDAIAAWNRRPTPASPGLVELRHRMLDAWAEGADKISIDLGELYALADRVERAEAELASVPQFSRAALMEFIEKVCLNKSELVACAESAFYWFSKCYGIKGAAAGAVPDDPDDDPTFCAWLTDHRITDGQKWLAWDAWCRGIESRFAAAPKAAPSQQAEVAPSEAKPVAWRRAIWGSGRWIFTDDQPTEELAWEPLFAAPPAQAEREDNNGR